MELLRDLFGFISDLSLDLSNSQSEQFYGRLGNQLC